MSQLDLFSPGELQRCLLCNVEYEPAVKAHACEVESDWTGCYRDSWKGLIRPDSFAHPAKFSRSLIHRIYQHARDEKWLAPGATVIDPFGGVALGGLEAAWHGTHWIGVELEQKFVDLGRSNIMLWQKRFGHMPTWGSVRLVQGDSRRLSTVLARAGLCISSPPYVDARQNWATTNERSGNIRYGNTEGQMSDMPATEGGLHLAISSPPFGASVQAQDPAYRDAGNKHGPRHSEYGESSGQLANMAISSPPYDTGCAQQGTDKHPERMRGSEYHPARYDLAVSSPPFAESLASDDPEKRGGLFRDPKRAKDKTLTATYGTSEGQIGLLKDTPDDFWTAAHEIVAQTYTVLAPNSHAIWVLKGFIRKKTYVDFPDQWRLLCEALGFKTLHWHRCWLIEPGEVQAGLLGEGEKDYTRERKSFFRRLAEKKGSLRIDFEVVLCMLKP